MGQRAEEETAMKGKVAEAAQWVLTIGNTINTLGDMFGKFGEGYSKLPPEIKQRLPGLFGLSLEDERLFNGVLCMIKHKDQLRIKEFLYGKCANFQRNRFINIVAGMEVVPGKPKTEERSWDKKSGKSTTKTTSGSEGLDRRKKFLESFAEIIKKKGIDAAYEYAIGARLIFSHSVFQDTIKQVGRLSGDMATKIEEYNRKNTADISTTTTGWLERAKNWRDAAPKRG